MPVRSEAIISRERIFIKGIPTHNLAQTILYSLRDYLERKGRILNVAFGGSPGPLGEGICIDIRISGRPLDRVDMNAIARFFKIAGISARIEGS